MIVVRMFRSPLAGWLSLSFFLSGKPDVAETSPAPPPSPQAGDGGSLSLGDDNNIETSRSDGGDSDKCLGKREEDEGQQGNGDAGGELRGERAGWENREMDRHVEGDGDTVPMTIPSQSQLATMEFSAKTMGAPSIEQDMAHQVTSEGTVQVAVPKVSGTGNRQYHGHTAMGEIVSGRRGSEMPANSFEVQHASHNAAQFSAAVAFYPGSEPDDSTAISKAGRPSSRCNDGRAGDVDAAELESRRKQTPRLQSQNGYFLDACAADAVEASRKDAESRGEQSHGAHCAYLGYNTVNKAACSQALGRISQDAENYVGEEELAQRDNVDNVEEADNMDQRALSVTMARALRQPAFSMTSVAVGDVEGLSPAGPKACATSSLTSQHKFTRNRAWNDDQQEDQCQATMVETPRSCQDQADMAPPGHMQAHGLSIATERSRVANNVLMTAAVTPHQLNSMVAAWSRGKSNTPRRGESSNSGNYRVLVGLKRKASVTGGTGRPPMGPPVQTVLRVPPGATVSQVTSVPQAQAQNHAQPSANSLGGMVAGPNTFENGTIAIEDAVSMVEHGFEGGIDVACDAISKASGEAAAASSFAAAEPYDVSGIEEVHGEESCEAYPSCIGSMGAHETSRTSFQNDPG